MIDTCFEWVLCFAAEQKWEVAGRRAVRDSKEVGERFWKDGNRTGERGGRSSSRSQQQYRQKTITAKHGGGVDGMMGCGRVQANKRARKRSGVGGHRPETATFPPSLAGWPFQSGFRQQPHDDFHPYVPPTFLPPLHTISGGSTPNQPLQPIRQDHRDNWPACILSSGRYMYLAKITLRRNQRSSLKIIRSKQRTQK